MTNMNTELSFYLPSCITEVIIPYTYDAINPKLLKRIRRYGTKYATGGFIFPSIVKQREIYNSHSARQERVYKRARQSINRLTYN